MMSETSTLTLTDFLLARIAEDEAVASGAWPESWEASDNSVRTTETGLMSGYEGLHMSVAHLAMTVGEFHAEARNATHIARHDPARVLAECEAKRRIVERCAAVVKHSEWMNDMEMSELWNFADSTLEDLALPYAGHVDYREEWRA